MSARRRRCLPAMPVRAVGHHERGLYLSAARSALFNWALADRVDQGSWNILQRRGRGAGRVAQLLLAEHIDDVLRERARGATSRLPRRCGASDPCQHRVRLPIKKPRRSMGLAGSGGDWNRRG